MPKPAEQNQLRRATKLPLYTYLVFRNGKLISVVQSTVEVFESAIDGDYVIDNPQEPEKQISQWKREHQ